MTLQLPEYLQDQSYSALRVRHAYAHPPRFPGVFGQGDFLVGPRGAGANRSVDVAAGFAAVQATDPGNAGMYHIQNDGTVNVTIATAHATLPRIDQIIMTINDAQDGGDVSNTPTLTVMAGTATSGATLDNRSGAASTLPTSSLRLADVLVGANATTISAANIRDRRLRAYGFRSVMVSTDADDTWNAFGERTAASLGTVRIESRGSFWRFEASGSYTSDGGAMRLNPANGVTVRATSAGANLGSRTLAGTTGGAWSPFIARAVGFVPAGSYPARFVYNLDTLGNYTVARAGDPGVTWTIEELTDLTDTNGTA